MPAARNQSAEGIAWRKERARLTRAVNSKDPLNVLLACEHYREHFVPMYGYSDFWSRWANAADDAAYQIRRSNVESPAVDEVHMRLVKFLDWIN